MSDIEFSKEEKELLVHKLKGYLNNELDFEIGQFDAAFLLDFFNKEMGVYHYGMIIDEDLMDSLESLLKKFAKQDIIYTDKEL